MRAVSLWGMGGIGLLLAALPVAQADDICQASDEQAVVKSIRAALQAAKPQSAAAFFAHERRIRNGCFTKTELDTSRAEIKRLGAVLSKQAVSRGDYFSKVDSGEQLSAYTWLERSGDFAAADQVLLTGLRAQPQNYALFQFAVSSDGSSARSTTSYQRPAAFKSEIQRLGQQRVQALLSQETAEFGAGNAPLKSLSTLKLAKEWSALLPEGTTAVRTRATTRGDTLAASGDPVRGGFARDYYQLAENSAKVAEMQKREAAFSADMQKAADSMKGAVKENSAAQKKAFKKGADDLENELGM